MQQHRQRDGRKNFLGVRLGSFVLSYRGSRGHSRKKTFDSERSHSAKVDFQRDAKNAFSGRRRATDARGCGQGPRLLRARDDVPACEFAHRWSVFCGRGCFHAIQLEILVRMVHVPSLDVSRAPQTPERPQNTPRTPQNASERWRKRVLVVAKLATSRPQNWGPKTVCILDPYEGPPQLMLAIK